MLALDVAVRVIPRLFRDLSSITGRSTYSLTDEDIIDRCSFETAVVVFTAVVTMQRTYGEHGVTDDGIINDVHDFLMSRMTHRFHIMRSKFKKALGIAPPWGTPKLCMTKPIWTSIWSIEW